MIITKYKLKNGNSVIVYRGDSEDIANDGIAPDSVVSSSYDKDADLGILVVMSDEKLTFEQASAPMMKYMAENHHPHTIAHVESNKSVLWEGVKTHLTDEFLVD